MVIAAIAAWSVVGSLLAVVARAWVGGIVWLLLWALLVGGPIVAVIVARRARPLDRARRADDE
jgi:hypothetical protein